MATTCISIFGRPLLERLEPFLAVFPVILKIGRQGLKSARTAKLLMVRELHTNMYASVGGGGD